jgi:hypothetical protein
MHLSAVDDVVSWLVEHSTGVRSTLWSRAAAALDVHCMLEVGVWKGEFAAHMLRSCPAIDTYHMIDPWRHLDDWNKPFNRDQAEFESIYREAMTRTAFAAERRRVHRGTTAEVVSALPNASLDLAYIDGDHTLRGIAVDLLRVWPKVRPGGILGGDDYTRTIWQHGEAFEPSLVCPFASHFAEGVGAPMVILAGNQFAIVKPEQPGDRFTIVDTTGLYRERALLRQVRRR